MGRDRAVAGVRPRHWVSTASGRPTSCPDLPWDAVIDASNSADLPALALDLVEPGRRVVYIGLAGTPSADRHPD